MEEEGAGVRFDFVWCVFGGVVGFDEACGQVAGLFPCDEVVRVGVINLGERHGLAIFAHLHKVCLVADAEVQRPVWVPRNLPRVGERQQG